MSRKKVPSREALIGALREGDGNMASVARKFGCARQTIWQYIDDDPELRELTDELTETFIDEAESQLYSHIRGGNVVACIFFLKTKARHRGYSERLELVPLAQQQIEVELGASRSIENEDRNAETLNCHSPAIALLEQ